MIKIAVIVPKDLVEITKAVASEYNESIDIIEGSMEKGLDIAKKCEESGFDVIVARGGTQLLLKNSALSIPTVPIPITVMDIHNAFKEAMLVSDKIAIIAFDNMVSASEIFLKITESTCEIIQVASEREIEGKFSYLYSKGIKAAIGGGVVERYGPRYGIEPIVIKTGIEAISTAIEEARRVALARYEENKRGQRFRTIVENSKDGIISVDKYGYLNILNATAEKLLNINGKEVIGKHIDDVLPQLELTEVLSTGVGDMEIVKNVRDSKLMVSNIPVIINGEVVDAISMLQDVSSIQRMEEKIRREIYTTGLYAKYTFDDIIGISSKSREAVRIGKEFAKVNSTILIEGETGTGKEVMAQSIHNYSNHSSGPFVAVNCAALPENLLESELFGYAPGSFTGADKKGKRGLFELAHMGTIFLDEISEMNPLLQGRLLRVLQEKQVMRIGDNKVIPINVRVITATNRSLQVQVEERKFRQDLFYRLNVLKIEIPPLRNKYEDIPYLIEHFVHQYSKKLDKPPIVLSKEALSYLCEYDWPGNVRELRNFVERLMVISKKHYFELEDIKDKFIIFKPSPANLDRNLVLNHTKANGNPSDQPDDHLYDGSEKDSIIKALKNNMGMMHYTAKALNISRTTLWRKMKKYDISIEE